MHQGETSLKILPHCYDCCHCKWCTAPLDQIQEGFGHWLQHMCCAYLILLSEYFRCVPGTPRIPEVLEVVQESEVIQSSREGSVEVKNEARSLGMTRVFLEIWNRGLHRGSRQG